MLQIFRRWYRRNFTNPQAVVLVVLLALGAAVVLLFGRILAPVFAALIIAFLLEQLMTPLQRGHCPRPAAVYFVYLAFLGILALIVFWLVPLVWQQISTLANELPNMMLKGQAALQSLPRRYPRLISHAQVNQLVNLVQSEAASAGQQVLSYSLTNLVNLASIVVYLFLVPFLVFFFLKDRKLLMGWLVKRLPKERHLARRVWREMLQQIGNYVRGKVIEMFITGLATYVVFAVMDLRFALLLAVGVGFSVVIPYVGIVVATVPVALVAYFQWGLSSDFGTLMLIYGIVQALDGVVLVPLLFSETVKLHPVAIVCAILVFGGVWGFWGVFFAIPLATLVKAVLSAWSEVVQAPTSPPEIEH